VEDNFGSSFDLFWVFGIFSDGESTTSRRFPSPLKIRIIRSGLDFDFLGNEISGVETDTKLTNHRNISTGGESFHESFGSRFSDSSEIVDQFLFGHTTTSILDHKGTVGFVWDNFNVHVWFFVHFGTFWVS